MGADLPNYSPTVWSVNMDRSKLPKADCRNSAMKIYYHTPERKAVVSEYIVVNSERRRKNTLNYMYGISVEDYNKMLEKQRGVCAICERPERRKTSQYLCVDHCHKTGKIRGLLCYACNSGIGKLDDSAALLKKAADYLERGAQW